MGDVGVGWGWIKDRLVRPTGFHGVCHGIVALQNHVFGAMFSIFLLILALDSETSNLSSYPMPSWQRSVGRRKIWDQLVPQYLPTPPGSGACSQWG